MKSKLLIAILILGSSFGAYAQEDNERVLKQKKAWQETGYGFPELFSERDFQVSECLKSEKMYVACLSTLDSMLGNLESDKKSIVITGDSKLKISNALPVPVTTEGAESEEPGVEKKIESEKRALYRANFKKVSKSDLEKIFKAVGEVVETSVPKNEQAYVAGRSFDYFLKQAFDPHTGIAPSESVGPRRNNYVGVGAFIQKFEVEGSDLKGAVAFSPMPDSPAEKAGLKKGDLLLSVDEKEVFDLKFEVVRNLILGEKGSTVKLRVKRICSGAVETVVVTRGSISHIADWTKDSKFVSLEKGNDPIDAICNGEKAELKAGEPQALYVPLSGFIHLSRNPMDLCREFIFDLQKRDLENPDSQGMIIDLRNNGGGYVPEVACMLDSLVHGNQGVIVGQQAVERGELLLDAPLQESYKYDFLNSGEPLTPYKDTRVHYNKKIVVLTNNNSASASEIFSGSIQDVKRGWVIGDRTFGKGSVQTPRTHTVKPSLAEPTDKALQIKRTTAIYTLNSGRSPQGYGIIPDFRFSELGETVEDKGELTGEAQRLNSIEFSNKGPQHDRSEEVKVLSTCAHAAGSLSATLKTKLKADLRYQIPFVSSYQLSLAKDVMFCAEDREAFIK